MCPGLLLRWDTLEKKGYFKNSQVTSKDSCWSYMFLLFGIKCCMWCFKWLFWFKPQFGSNFELKLQGTIFSASPTAGCTVNQGVNRLCIPSSLVWCSAVTSWTESSVEALSPWGLSLQQKEIETVLYTDRNWVSSFTTIKDNLTRNIHIGSQYLGSTVTDIFAHTEVSASKNQAKFLLDRANRTSLLTFLYAIRKVQLQIL